MEWQAICLLFGIVCALIGVIWKLLNDKIDAIWDQIGRDSKKGMRGDLHGVREDMAYQLSLETRIERIEKYLNGKLDA